MDKKKVLNVIQKINPLISLTCITSKLLEHIICPQIRSHLDEHEILSPFQHGFRGKHSCESQLTVTYQDLARLNDHKVQVDIDILGFNKAFDVVPHCRLLKKQKFYGINEVTCNWIQNFFAGLHQKIMVDGVFSKEENVDSGNLQGTVSGPLLFLLFINDIPNNLSAGTTIRLAIFRRLPCIPTLMTSPRNLSILV